MTQEEITLLFKDLCGRLPYGVIVETTWKEKYSDETCDGTVGKLRGSQLEFFIEGEYSDVKPYLRPLSSMTEEEKTEFEEVYANGFGAALDAQISGSDERIVRDLETFASSDVIDWLIAHHFDFRCLIEKGLAIAVTEENNPYK